MKSKLSLLMVFFFVANNALAMEVFKKKYQSNAEADLSNSKVDVEKIWANYLDFKGLTWGRSKHYPEYSQVKEGDTFMVELKQGPCLMEFFHGRWRRANDVRRWDKSINDYGGCPYVFD